MNLVDRNQYIAELFKRAYKVLENKGADYNREQNAWSVLEADAAQVGLTVPQVIWVHASKHLSAIRSHVSGKRLLGDPLEEKCIDVMNYMGMIAAYERYRSEGKGTITEKQPEPEPEPETDMMGRIIEK